MTTCRTRLAVALLLTALLGGCQLTHALGLPGDGRPVTQAPVRAAARSVRVAPGDTVYRLSREHNVSVRAVIEANGLTPPYRLYPGQTLVIPSVAEHVVASGETLMGISRRYGVAMSEIARANDLTPPHYLIKVGQRLVLTGGAADTGAVAAAPPAPAPAPVVRDSDPVSDDMPSLTGSRVLMIATSPNAAAGSALPDSSSPTRLAPVRPAPIETVSADPKPAAATAQPVSLVAARQPQVAPAPEAPLQPLPEPPKLTGGFDWPARGSLVAKYGSLGKGKHNDGINIELPRGAPVRASADGVVAYAGNELRGFGNLLLIKHSDGWMSAYAHNDDLLVRRGDTVKRGQVVAKAGQSGNVRSPQLHFELRKDANAVDPLKHLPSYKASLE